MSAELGILSRIRTLADAVAAFSDDNRCRRLLEAMVWPRGRLCPACGCHRSISLAGRERVVGHGQGFINALTRIAGSNSQ